MSLLEGGDETSPPRFQTNETGMPGGKRSSGCGCSPGSVSRPLPLRAVIRC